MNNQSHTTRLESAPNFRDLGGLCGIDGRRIRVGQLYRSEALSRLSDHDLNHIATLNIALVVDLRTTEERLRSRNRWPQERREEKTERNVPGSTTEKIVETLEGLENPNGRHAGKADTDTLNAVNLFGWRERIADPTLDPAAARQWMQHAYTEMPYLFANFLTAVFARLGTPANPAPITLLHCTAGKDRTGFMSAMLQFALGVRHDDVMHNYLLTRERRSPEHLLQTLLNQELAQANATTRAALLTIADVDADYLSCALHTIERDYGSLHHYFSQACGMNADRLVQLQHNLLE